MRPETHTVVICRGKMATGHGILIYLGLSMVLARFVRSTPVLLETAEEEYLDIRLPNDTAPIHYNIALIPYIDDNFTFDGETNIDFKVQRPTANVVLHALRLKVDQAATTVVAEDGTVFVPKEHVYKDDPQFLIIRFKTPLALGVYTLNLKYSGFINSQLTGFYRSFYVNDEGEKVWVATTHFEPTMARSAFPCWDEPAFKASFNVSVKHYTNYTVISNMPVYEVGASGGDEDDKVWTRFEKSPVMCTYLVDFIVADFVANADGSVSVWSRPNAVNRTGLALEYAVKVQAELERYANSTVRVPKMDHIAIPHYNTRATEHWGAITYVEHAILYDEKTNGITDKQSTVMVIAHELAHQWFGNVVSPVWWKYLWLSEAFAVHYQYYIINKIISDWRLEEYFVVNVVFPFVFTADTLPNMPPISPNVNTTFDIRKTFHYITYRKGASVVRMMSHILTEDVFHTAILDYLDTHDYGVATSEDLFAAMQKALDESDVVHDDSFNMTEAMLPWIEESNYPLVTVARNYTTGDITISQENIFNVLPKPDSGDKKDTKWWVPINFATQSDPDFSKTYPTHWLKPTDEELTITGVDMDDWVIVNIQHTGHYRINYDATNWRRLGKYLNSENRTDIHPLNRAGIINGAFEMMQAGKLSPTIFFEITNYLSHEKDFIPWHSAFHIIKSASDYILHQEWDTKLRSHILSLMDHLINEVGFEDLPGESDLNKLQRIDLRQIACDLDDNRCKGNATIRLIQYAEDPNGTITPNDMHEWVFCSGMKRANETIWRKLLDIYYDRHESWLLNYLSCVENATVLEDFLNLLIADDSPIQRSHASHAFRHMIAYNPANLDLALDFFANNSRKITAAIPEPYQILETAFNARITRSQYEKIMKLQSDGNHHLDTNWKLLEIEKTERILSKLRDSFPKKDGTESTVDNTLD